MMANGVMGMNGVGMGSRVWVTVEKSNRDCPGYLQALLPRRGGDVFMDQGSDQGQEDEDSAVSIDYCMWW